MAKFIVRGLNQTPYDPSLCSNPTTFTDVPCGHTFWGAIERFYRDGITSGCGTGIYCPNNNVSRSEMAAFISKGWQYSQPQVAGTLPGRYSIYTPEMNLLSETSISPPGSHPILYEYVWFNGHPVAQVDLPATVHWTFTDHLGTPLLQTQSDGTTMFWRAEYEPYGRLFTLRTTDQHQPLRLPGQEAEELNVSTDGNGQTERSYNIFRWYRAKWRQYTQGDPAWAAFRIDELNNYVYAINDPVGFTDPLGLSGETSIEYWDCVANCIEKYKFSNVYMLIGSSANAAGNYLVGGTGRTGVAGVPPHPTTWENKVGAEIARKCRPLFPKAARLVSRGGRLAGRAAIALTIFEGFYDIGTIGRCMLVCEPTKSRCCP